MNRTIGRRQLKWLFPFVLGVMACGGPLRYTVHGSPRAPEADGVVQADVQREQSMTRLNIRMEHLAPPGRLQEGGRAYVVWARRNSGATWIRVGALQYNEGSRMAEMRDTTVSETSFELIVTVETEPSAQTPSTTIILQQMVNPPRVN